MAQPRVPQHGLTSSRARTDLELNDKEWRDLRSYALNLRRCFNQKKWNDFDQTQKLKMCELFRDGSSGEFSDLLRRKDGDGPVPTYSWYLLSSASIGKRSDDGGGGSGDALPAVPSQAAIAAVLHPASVVPDKLDTRVIAKVVLPYDPARHQ
ncbi:MAG: hypothetical protein M1817_003661 [Caeruleum heppii]|nr:MAG: hypothetical protein M1817_003661 [Caeruleum heppii]